MATFEQNIRNIQGDAVYGPDVRASIAEAITQAIDLDISGEGAPVFNVEPIASTPGDYLLSIINAE